MVTASSNRRRLAGLGSARAVARAVVLAVVLVLVPAAAASLPPRVTIGVFGDSVVEGYTIPHFLRDTLVPRLQAEVPRVGGFQAGGTGLIPASVFRWHFSRYTVAGTEEVPRADAWTLSGFSAQYPGPDGLSGYSAIALSPDVTASAPIKARLIGVLFTKYSGSGVFTVTAGGQSFAIDARSSGPPTPTEQWITVPAGARTITVHGPATGSLIFDGVIDRAPVDPGHIGVEVENLGHMGHRLAQDSAPRILAALLRQRFDISVFLSAYIWEFAGSNAVTGYAQELRARVALVRGYGGLCLIADPSPLPPELNRIIPRFAAVDRQVAAQTGCTYFPGLAHLWNPLTAVRRGLTLIDGVHPRAPGYRLMAQALAPVLAKMVRDRVRTRGY